MATAMDKEDVVITPYFPPRRRTVPELLASRQLHGVSYRSHVSTRTIVSPEKLSSSIAWNTSRLQNTILAVGPGTPAAAAASPANPPEDSSSSSSSASADMEQDDDEEEESDEEMEDTNDEDSNTNEDDAPPRFQRTIRVGANSVIEQMFLDFLQQEQNDESEDSEPEPVITSTGNLVPSIRHGGCINTAAWLTSPWRLSLSGHESEAIDSDDCPTQLLTSGDDKTVMFWDVRHAMGSANPFPGGKYSQCPFADLSECELHDWKQHDDFPLAGSVIPLATLSTGHRNNVFHVTPVDAQPGKVVTCGADGYLRMADINRPNESSQIIVSPEYTFGIDDILPIGLFSLRASHMCFSHHFINANTGLLCAEHGLYRFDLRLSPREQSSRSLLGNDLTCKSCAIWSASSFSADDIDSAYVFAGGASSEVALYDLRMTDGSDSRIIQKYRPSGLSATSDVSVSGLDVSKDKRELLVSYENDQIFTFPVFPNTPGGRPSVDELGEYSSSYNKEDQDGPHLSELAAYGGHLNRFTFLKNAKYAGPEDEYICTGSDSGRAWIYERATGTVAAFLAADQSTCNGVIPHPSLPFFITYGIDSTAKLWRATNPVDRDADDSPLGRARRHHGSKYEKSAVVRSWSYVKATSASIASLDEEDAEGITMYPDQFPVNESPVIGDALFGGILMRRHLFGVRGARATGICNDLRELPRILQKNLFACVIASEEGESEPISSGLADLARRMSIIRTRFQADQRGLVWNSKEPWALSAREFYKGKELAKKAARKEKGEHESPLYGNSFDLVPESPGDWLPYDPDTTKNPLPSGPRFNTDDYAEFYEERYSQLGIVSTKTNKHESTWTDKVKQRSDSKTSAHIDVCAAQEENAAPYDSERALRFLHDTALMLKEGGDAALDAESVMEAARRYDCAIKYCAVAFLVHPNANQDFLQATERKWCPLRRVLVTTRLSLCTILSNFDLRGAREQATLALKEVAPFCKEHGKVMAGKKLSVVHSENEPQSTYREAKELQAKAYFLQGSINMKVGDYAEAVNDFEESVKCTRELSNEPDGTLLRQLADAKREKYRENKRPGRKFSKRKLECETMNTPRDETDDSPKGVTQI